MEKRSRQRELLLEVLRGTTCHPDADWVFSEMRKTMPGISLGTVYRNLARLAADGVITKLQVGQHADRFDGTINPHYHMACKACGKVVDLMLPYDFVLDEAAQNESGCKIDSHTLVFYGECPSCMGK